MNALTRNNAGDGGWHDNEEALVVSRLQKAGGDRGYRIDAEGAAGGHLVPVAFHQTQDPITERDGTPALGRTSIGMGVMDDPRRVNLPQRLAAAEFATGVRRLTPRECERLQGWPDDYTRWDADGREAPDSRRYAAIGDGVTAPVTEWIGRRLMEELTA